MSPSIYSSNVLNKLMKSDSTLGFSSVKPQHGCYEPETSLLLLFNTQQNEPIIKERTINLWKALRFLPQTNLLDVAKELSKQEDIASQEFTEEFEETSPEPSPQEGYEGVRQLFIKMLKLRMDKHALAIADGYRTRPQVCVCNDECCSCICYSQFLHNLKLHNHKKLLRKAYVQNVKGGKKKPIQVPTKNPTTASQSKSSSRKDVNDEFSLKIEEDSEEDSDCDPIKTAVINRIKNEICSSSSKNFQPSCENPKKHKNDPLKKVTRRVGSKRGDSEPPYETKFNSVHRRVREFDPDSYKILVREEIKQLNEMPAPERKLWENRVRDPAARPPWKI